MNWLCRMIGHKWHIKRPYAIDGVKMQDVMLFSHCMRCGEKRPSGKMIAEDHASATKEPIA